MESVQHRFFRIMVPRLGLSDHCNEQVYSEIALKFRIPSKHRENSMTWNFRPNSRVALLIALICWNTCWVEFLLAESDKMIILWLETIRCRVLRIVQQQKRVNFWCWFNGDQNYITWVWMRNCVLEVGRSCKNMFCWLSICCCYRFYVEDNYCVF